MSHRHERKEKICLNCDTELHDRYCHNCGQENIEPKQSFWHLVTHFVYDVTHFDGKFFSTVKYLLLRPGFLSAEYIKGRRASFLDPIKMYVFTSAFFFIFFFSVVVSEDKFKTKETPKKYTYEKTVKAIKKKKDGIKIALQSPDIALKERVQLETRLKDLEADSIRLLKDTTNLDQLNINSGVIVLLGSKEYSSYAKYDSVQKRLPEKEKDNWLERQVQRKKFEVIDKYGKNSRAILNALLNKFFHSFPQILFVSLPLIAFILKLLYIRRKQFYYVDHVIYCVHLYCAMFIMIFVTIILSRVEDLPYMNWVSYVALLFLFYIFWYIYKSMRNFYRQRRGRTFLKYFLLLFISFIVMNILSIIFFVFSAFTI